MRAILPARIKSSLRAVGVPCHGTIRTSRWSLPVLLTLLGVTFAGLGGCSMGRAAWYETYTADGGNWERIDPVHGRVGSAFSDAGVRRTISDQVPPIAPPPAADESEG